MQVCDEFGNWECKEEREFAKKSAGVRPDVAETKGTRRSNRNMEVVEFRLSGFSARTMG